MLRIVGLATLSIVAIHGAAHGAVDENCVPAVQHQLQRHSFAVSMELDRRPGILEQRFERLHATLVALRAYRDGSTVARCAQQSPQHRRALTAWLQRVVAPVEREAQAELDRVCPVHTKYMIRRSKSEISRAFRRGELYRAVALADELEQTLTRRVFYAQCRPVADLVANTVGVFVARVRDNAAIPKVARRMAEHHFYVLTRWDSAHSALKTTGGRMIDVPPDLVTSEGRRVFSARAVACAETARALRSLNASDDLVLPKAKGMQSRITLAQAERRCDIVRVAARDFLVRAAQHHRAYEAAQLERWKYANIKGWGMEKVFRNRGKPQTIIPRSANTIIWSYANAISNAKQSCTRFYFTARGQLKKRSIRRCALSPQVARAAASR